MNKHELFMARALELAREAVAAGDVPVGCVIVRDGKIVGEGKNTRERDKNATQHAEIAAVSDACSRLKSWRLEGCALYVTLEPCPMCAGAIINSRISEVYFGARDRKGGAVGGVINLFEENFNHKPAVYPLILEEECKLLLEDFFKKLR